MKQTTKYFNKSSDKKKGLLSRFIKKIRGFILSSQGFPITLVLTLLCILFVLFRMKGIEHDYHYNNLNRKISAVEIDQKEVLAEKARLLSIKNLQKIAKQHNMKEPKQNQIIVIPR